MLCPDAAITSQEGGEEALQRPCAPSMPHMPELPCWIERFKTSCQKKSMIIINRAASGNEDLSKMGEEALQRPWAPNMPHMPELPCWISIPRLANCKPPRF